MLLGQSGTEGTGYSNGKLVCRSTPKHTADELVVTSKLLLVWEQVHARLLLLL